MSLAKKLNLKDGMSLRVVGKPKNFDFDDVKVGTSAKADALLIFVKTLAEVDTKCGPLIQAAKADRVAWAAYPKAGQLGTDLNRDVLWKHLLKGGVQGVRQIALDSTWSALRFRPARVEREREADAPAVDPRFSKIVKALSKERGVTYGGKGFGSSALKVGGKIFAMLSSKGEFVVKLSKKRVDELVRDGEGRYFDPGRGRLMKEWLSVTAAPRRWLALAKDALAYARQA